MKDRLNRALGPVKKRLRLARLCRAGGWGMLCGAAAGLAVLLTAYFFPLPEKWRLAAALIAAGGCASGLVGFIWPIREETAALAADQCGLKERAQTALMLRNEDGAMAELQRQDACQALQALDARKIPLPRSKKLLSAFAALMLLMGGVSLLPDPQAQALARIEQFNKRMEEALQLAKQEEEKLAGDSSLRETQEMRKILSDLERQLRSARQERDAYLALDDAEKRLEKLRSASSPEASAQALNEAGLSELAEAVKSGQQEAMDQAAQSLMQQGEAGAQSLAQAASMMDGAAAQAMQSAASAVLNGDMSQLSAALSGLSMQDMLSALSRMESMLSQMRALNGNAAGQLSGQGKGQGEGTGQGTGAGQGQGEGEGGGAGRGTTHEDAGYKEDTGRQRGQGSDKAEYRENAYEAIYDPTRLEAAETDIQESGAMGAGESLQIQSGPGLGSLNGQVPYRQVAAEYEAAAAQAMAQQDLPSREQAWVNDYFSAITE